MFRYLNRSLKPFVVAASILLPAAAAHAADAENRFAIKGAAVAPCSQFIEVFDAKSDDVLLFAGWISGFVTAINQVTPKTFDIAPWQSTEVMLFLMRDLCGRTPDQQFYRVAGNMAGLLAQDKLENFSDPVNIKNGEFKTVLPKAVVAKVQEELKARNFYTGGIDGAFGPGTQTAIEAFQKQQQIEQTGIPDQQTLVRLMYQQSEAQQ
jgi:hypothetical protein